MMGALSVLLPIAFSIGIAARKPVPLTMKLPHEFGATVDAFPKLGWSKTDLWPGQHIVTSLRRSPGGSYAVVLTAPDLARPDVLVYWVGGKSTGGVEPLENARLLGAWTIGVPLPLPANTINESGHMILYSLATHEIVASSEVFAANKD